MRICHIALGGCITAPLVDYGLTEDTGGHIAYLVSAAYAQTERADVSQVDIVTRAFSGVRFSPVYDQVRQTIRPKLTVHRLRTSQRGYLAKEALEAHIPELMDAFLDWISAQDEKPNLIHAHFGDAAVLARAAQERFDIPFFYTPHSLALSKGGEGASTRRIAYERKALKHADATIVSSRDEAEIQVGRYGHGMQARVMQVPPGVCTRHGSADELPELFTAPFDDPTRPLILAIARPVARKNLARLAQLYAYSQELQSSANLMIVAGQHDKVSQNNSETARELATLDNVLNSSHLSGRVSFPARHTPSDIPALYDYAAKSFGVFVNIADHEPFGLTLLEAAQHGLPVVGTKNGGAADIIRRIGHGVSVDPDDETAIIESLLRLLRDHNAWQIAANSARSRMAQYDWSNWADTIVAHAKAERGPCPFAAPRVLISDIDGTLTGCPVGAARFAYWANSGAIPFAVATGRSISEARRVLQDWELPEPEAFITSVGTELYLRDGAGRYQLDKLFADRLSADWPRGAVDKMLRQSGLQMQPDVEQRPWKISAIGNSDLAEALETQLRKRGLPAQVIFSHGRFIDVVPRHAGKANAIDALCLRLGFDRANVIVAGDSGNDSDMLLAAARGAGHGIVVGNAMEELTAILPEGRLYRAEGRHANGVLEGLQAIGAMAHPDMRVAAE